MSALRLRVTDGRLVALTMIALLAISVIAGQILYAGRVAARWGDDWTAFGPSPYATGWQELIGWYTRSDGRLGDGLLMALLRTPLDPLGFGPDDFPWWLILSFSTFAVIATPLMIVLGLLRLSPPVFSRVELVAIATAILTVWAGAPVTYAVTTYPVLVTFTAPVFAASLAFLLLSWNRTGQRVIAVSGGLYLYASLSMEQFLTGLPLLFAAVAIARARPRRWRAALAAIAPWVVLSITALVIYFGSPGQARRSGLVHSGLPNSIDSVAVWLERSVDAGYSALTGIGTSQALAFHVLLFAVLAWSAFAGSLRGARSTSPAGTSSGVGRSGLVFLGAFHMSLAHLLFSPYFPEGRTRFFPALLLVLAIASGAIVIVRWLARTDPRLTLAATTAGALFVLVTVTVPSVFADIGEYRRAKLETLVKRNTYDEVVRLHARTGASHFRLTRCPPTLDAPWGFAAYFAWRGHPEIAAVLEGDGDTSAALAGQSWTVVDCRVPLLFPWPEPRPSPAAGSLRKIEFVDAQMRGGFDNDFWVPLSVSNCTVRGRYNPNVGGSPLYEESFVYSLSFGTGFANEPVRLIEAREISAVRWSDARITIGYAVGGAIARAVPVEAFSAADWQARPVVRVSVTQVGPGWITAYSDVRISCDDP